MSMRSNKVKLINTQIPTRRLNTQPDEPMQNRNFAQNIKSSERTSSKHKYLDVVSKFQCKGSSVSNRPFKMNPYKQVTVNNRVLKTQPNQPPNIQKNKPSNSIANQPLNSPQSKYQVLGTAGKGTFGVVYYGRARESGLKIAIKKVLQDKRYKNRQLQIMQLLKHPSILEMKDHYMTREGDHQYLNVVMNFYPENLYQVVKKREISTLQIKLYMYQLLRGLNYLNMLSIAHRDIKPHNILVDRNSHKVVICDFGSAKQLVKGEGNLAYICSRCYRAPQLIFGATDYTPQIDMWSLGCVLVEMVNGDPPFIGDSQMDQLIEIIKVLGTPSWQEVYQMNSQYSKTQYAKFPYVKSTEWKKNLKTKDQKLIDLINKILSYSPAKRLSAAEAMTHSFFDDLRDQNAFKQLQKKIGKLPELFNFTKCMYLLKQEQMQSFGVSSSELLPQWSSTANLFMNSKSTKQRNSVQQRNSIQKNSISIKKKVLQKLF